MRDTRCTKNRRTPHLPALRDAQGKGRTGPPDRPGAAIEPTKLLKEIRDCAVEPKRLTLDEQAVVISPEDRKWEEENLKQEIVRRPRESARRRRAGWRTASATGGRASLRRTWGRRCCAHMARVRMKLRHSRRCGDSTGGDRLSGSASGNASGSEALTDAGAQKGAS